MEARQRFQHAEFTGAQFVGEMWQEMGCRTERGYQRERFFRNNVNPRFHDIGLERDGLRIAFEMKAGAMDVTRTLEQLRKDQQWLAQGGIAVWLVRDLDKAPTKVREQFRALQQRYPDQFVLREVTPQNQTRVMEEMRELLRTQELETWRGLEIKLDMKRDRARDDLAKHLELMSGRVREFGWNDQTRTWAQELTPAQLREYQKLDQQARALWVTEQDRALELAEVREQIPQIELELAQVREQRADRERALDLAVEQERQRMLSTYSQAQERGRDGPAPLTLGKQELEALVVKPVSRERVQARMEQQAYQLAQDSLALSGDLALVKAGLAMESGRLRAAMENERDPHQRQALSKNRSEVVAQQCEFNALENQIDPQTYAALREHGPLQLEPGTLGLVLTPEGRDPVTIEPDSLEARFAEMARTAHGGRFPGEREQPAPQPVPARTPDPVREPGWYAAAQQQIAMENAPEQERHNELAQTRALEQARILEQQRTNERGGR